MKDIENIVKALKRTVIVATKTKYLRGDDWVHEDTIRHFVSTHKEDDYFEIEKDFIQQCYGGDEVEQSLRSSETKIEIIR